MAPLRGEAGEGRAALLEVPGGRDGGPGGGAGGAAAGGEGRLGHYAAQAALADRERELAVVAVEEAVALVEAADRGQHVPPQREADAVHGGDLQRVAAEVRGPLQRVDDRAAGVAAV